MSRGTDSPSIADWISGARPRTLPLAVSPVILGTASAAARDLFDVMLAVLAALVAMALQVGVNYANDYSDGIRGTDDFRVGPQRLTGSGLASPQLVKRASFLAFAVAAVAGVILVTLAQAWWLLTVGLVAFIGAWNYTGGEKPYGYRGLGELGVFVFFGLVATVGTAYVQVGVIPWETWITGAAAGFFASAVLWENNLRDMSQDRLAGKKTLAVICGRRRSQLAISLLLFMPYLLVGFLTPLFVWAPFVFITAVLSGVIAVIVWRAQGPKDLVLALQLTTVNSLVYAIALSAAIIP